jgi:tetratricopeptide (TPR) repeat protein
MDPCDGHPAVQASPMKRSGDAEPRGFQGAVPGWASLVPVSADVVQLPRDRANWRTAAAGRRLVEVMAWTEALGRIEDTLPLLAEKLAADGVLLLDIDNVQSAAMLRQVVDGRAGQYDPTGNFADPTVALPLSRVLAAAVAAGLCVVDVVRVPAPAEEFPAGFASALFAQGLAPLAWLQGQPPVRHWLVCRKQTAVAGSVLVAGGDPEVRSATAAAIRSWLPSEWQIVVGDDAQESIAWNRAFSRAAGEIVWFVRGGAAPTVADFTALAARAVIGPVWPMAGSERAAPGDIAGLMAPRKDLLLVGPIDERFANTRVALEDYVLRLEAALPLMDGAKAAWPSPAAPIERQDCFAEETSELFAAWSALQPATKPAATPTAPTAGPRPAAPWQDRAPRISLCMIAKNEERFLGECLARAKDAVDEIVLVDTGSTDRTVEIAASFGARVLHAPWQDDFSAPRNVGLQAATGDWILVLDADEFLQPGACERIRDAAQDANVLGYHLRFINVYGGGKTLGVMMVRLFRNLPGIAYQNVIHEQVTPSLQRIGQPMGLVLSSADVEVEHHGYSDAVMTERGKTERNERLFKKQLAEAPDDIYCLYKYGDFLRRVPGRSVDARALLDRCFDRILAGSPSLPRELPYAAEVASLCALEAARVEDRARALQILDVALRRFVPTPNLHYLTASIALAEGRAEDAIHHYRRCLAYRDQVLVVPVQEGITSYVSYTGIAQAWILRGQRTRARDLLRQAIAEAPAYEVAHLALSKLQMLEGDMSGAIATLTGFLSQHPDSPGACQQLSLILQRIGQTDVARRVGQRAVALLSARALDHEAAAMERHLAAR